MNQPTFHQTVQNVSKELKQDANRSATIVFTPEGKKMIIISPNMPRNMAESIFEDMTLMLDSGDAFIVSTKDLEQKNEA